VIEASPASGLLALAWLALGVAAAWDLRAGRIPNYWLVAAVALAVLGRREPSMVVSAVVAALPLLALASVRVRGASMLGMGDAKFAGAAGALLPLAAVPWFWAWALLGAAVTLTLSGLARSGRDPAGGMPFAPALLAAAVVAALGLGA
jgi:leader peptidase (prepilin peptidase)/N-methyltransferase